MGTTGSRRRLSCAMLAAFILVLAAVTFGNAESMIADFAAAGVEVRSVHVWIWQVTSIVAWGSAMVAIWWTVARVSPPRASWRMAIGVGVVGVVVASAWHIGVMIGLRHLAYWMLGETYHFQGNLGNPYLYEFRKDVPTYLQFVGLCVLCQWLLSRVEEPLREPSVVEPEQVAARTFAVVNGSLTRHVLTDEIEHVTAAGNYVELAWREQILLHRATLTAIEAELGPSFVRIHRSRLVRKAAIRAVEVKRTGDFDVLLDSGARLAGSRRYRAGLDRARTR